MGSLFGGSPEPAEPTMTTPTLSSAEVQAASARERIRGAKAEGREDDVETTAMGIPDEERVRGVRRTLRGTSV